MNWPARLVCKLRGQVAFASRSNGIGIPRPTGPSSDTVHHHSAPERQALPKNEPQRFPVAATRHKDFPDGTTRGKLHGSGGHAPALFSIVAAGWNRDST